MKRAAIPPLAISQARCNLSNKLSAHLTRARIQDAPLRSPLRAPRANLCGRAAALSAAADSSALQCR
jgi:hypothetical protein